jgi:hypothetical protein
MSKTISLRKEDTTIRLELTAEELIQQSKKILQIKEKAMSEDVHFGIIPGCKKPSLWKAGAERLCKAFRLEPQFETTSRDDPNRTISWRKWSYDERKEIEGTTMGYIEYDSRCTLIHIPTGDVWVTNVSASCNNWERRYRSLSPYDVKNTLEKMSEKRSLVAAVLIGTAASDIFTQDLEDLPQLLDVDDEAPDVKPQNNNKNITNNNNARMATERQVNYIQKLMNKKDITEKEFFEEWDDYFKSFKSLPFNLVNDVLAWIQEQ